MKTGCTPFLPLIVLFVVQATAFHETALASDRSRISIEQQSGRLKILIDGKPFTTYVYQDENTLRPHFTNVRTPAGIQVTRRHPPRKGIDPADHAELHPGIWLAFGDISGADFWRNRAQVEHIQFVEKPKVSGSKATFSVKNRYVSAGKTICTETCRHTILVRPAGYLLLYDSEFRSDTGAFYFGDQEEMGLGVRVATRLRVKGGNGRILNSDGKKNESKVRGTAADWVDYSGTIDNQQVGMMVIPHPRNFRPSWYHARDYGFITANPFGRNALTGGQKSKVVVEAGKTLRLRFGVLVHSSAADSPVDLEAAYRDYREQVGVPVGD